MKRLILMRHAKSDWALGLADIDRPLNARGRTSAGALGHWLRTKAYVPDDVLCSSAARTRETLALLEVNAPPRFLPQLYLADEKTLLDNLRQASGDTVLLIAHNPGISDAAQTLVDQPAAHPDFERYPTGATLVADFEISDWAELTPGTGTAVEFVIPRELLA